MALRSSTGLRSTAAANACGQGMHPNEHRSKTGARCTTPHVWCQAQARRVQHASRISSSTWQCERCKQPPSSVQQQQQQHLGMLADQVAGQEAAMAPSHRCHALRIRQPCSNTGGIL
jgi:hypothetical protein